MNKIYFYYFLFISILLGTPTFGQVNYVPSYETNPRSSLSKIAVDDGFKNGWLRIKDSVSLTPALFISKYRVELGLTNHDVLVAVDTIVDQQKNTHIKYKQYHKGIPVIGADYTIHLQNNRVYQVNGKLAENLSIDTQPSISENSAFQSSITRYKSNREYKGTIFSENKERLPEQPELTIVKNYSASYAGKDWHLAWKVPVGTSSGILADDYIDASSGEIIKSAQRSVALTVPTSIPFKNYGNLERPSNVNVPQRYLLNSTTASFYPIYSRYLQGANNLTFNSIRTSNNTYQTSSEVQLPSGAWAPLCEAIYTGSPYSNNSYPNSYFGVNDTPDFGTRFGLATLAMWIGSKYLDYLNYNYGRFGINIGPTSQHRIGQLLVGANERDTRYLGEFSGRHRFIFGSTNQISQVALDVVGHELTHALIAKTAGLVYENESGAINESIADIMGVMLERFVLPNNWNWTIGEDGVTVRDLQNSWTIYEIFQLSQPYLFEGTSWRFTSGCNPTKENDYCGVHINSGVMNRWFYLISTGGTFNGQNITSIGPHAAQQITYWALANYLQTHSTMSDARWSTMAAARDIYGECSNEYNAVVRAWNAVNVISPTCPGSSGRIAATPINPLSESLIKVYPNPATDFITIQLGDSADSRYLQLFDVAGKIIKTWTTPEQKITFPIKGLTPGVYLLKAQTSQGTYTQKIIFN